MESIKATVNITFDENDECVRNEIENMIKNHTLSKKISGLLISDIKSKN